MAEGRGGAEWAQTSWILHMLYSAHRGKDAPAYKPRDFNPYAEKPRVQRNEEGKNFVPYTMEQLQAIFVGSSAR